MTRYSMIGLLALWGCGALSSQGAEGFTLSWAKNILSISHPELPGGPVETWYLEAFCRAGSTHRDWNQTTIPHRTELVSVSDDKRGIVLRTVVEPDVEILHRIKAGKDEVDFQLTLHNRGTQPSNIEWFQPCMRVDKFTQRRQTNYFERCFIYTQRGRVMLDKIARSEDAIYRGGQVYVPRGINTNDVNPRPLSPEEPVNGLIGCVSADNSHLLATAWDQTQELFQGVIVCIHNDPRVGGLLPGQKKDLHGKIYFLANDSEELLRRYRADFPDRPSVRAQ